MKKSIEIAYPCITYSAHLHSKDADGTIFHTRGHLGTHEISLEHFPEDLRNAIVSFVRKAEYERMLENGSISPAEKLDIEDIDNDD